MNKYISSIEHENQDITDEFERAKGQTKKYCITAKLNRTSDGKCFILFVDQVKLIDELGLELPAAEKCPTGINYVPALRFCFDFDPDFCELQNKTVFEITLHESRSDTRETFKYMLCNHSWEEISED